jgi:hypothetical protein
VCEDYARAGKTDDGTFFAIVSDGCSSSPDTDCGARILVLKALEELNKKQPVDTPLVYGEETNQIDLSCLNYLPRIGMQIFQFHKTIANAAQSSAQAMGLDTLCLDATLLMLLATPNEIIATCWGDGVIVQKFQSGIIRARIISYPNGFPSYPSYLLNSLREENCKKMNDVTKKIIILTPDGKSQTEILPPEDVQYDFTSYILNNGNEDPLIAMAIFSDGIQSFSRAVEGETSKTKKPVDVIELLPKLMSFSGTGEFTRRRLNGLMRKEPDLSHYDDLGMGAIIL